jgi:mannose-6-phosphate isomerase-like protein (cupin superfamily)
MKKLKINEYKGSFFEVLQITENSQIAVMTIKPGGDSGADGKHKGDQIVYIIEGEGKIKIPEEEIELIAGELAIIPEKTDHLVINTGKSDLFFLTIYAPAEY